MQMVRKEFSTTKIPSVGGEDNFTTQSKYWPRCQLQAFKSYWAALFHPHLHLIYWGRICIFEPVIQAMHNCMSNWREGRQKHTWKGNMKTFSRYYQWSLTITEYFFSRLAAVKEIQITHSSPTQNPVVNYGCVFAFLKFCFCFCFNMTTVWSLTRWSGQVALFRLNTWVSSTLHCAPDIRPCSHTVQTTSTVHCTKPCHLKLCWQQKSLQSS